MTGLRTGLNYPSIETIFRVRKIKKKKRPEVFRKLQILELAALATWGKQNA